MIEFYRKFYTIRYIPNVIITRKINDLISVVKYHFNDIVDLPLLLPSFFISFDRNKIKNVANSKNILQFCISNFIFNIRGNGIFWEMEAYQNFDTNKIYI